MTLHDFIDWASAHPIAAFIRTVIALYLIFNLPRILILIPGALKELRDERKSKQIEQQRQETYKGPWS